MNRTPAIVIGGSMGGLLTARAMEDHSSGSPSCIAPGWQGLAEFANEARAALARRLSFD